MFNEVFFTDVRLPAANLVGDVNGGWALAKVTLGNERVSLSGGGALWGSGPTASDLLDHGARATAAPPIRSCASGSRASHIEAEVLRLIRLRTVTARDPGPSRPGRRRRCARCSPTSTASTSWSWRRTSPAPTGMLTGAGRRRPTRLWHYGYLFARALTIGGGTSEVQRNIIAERVLGLPHDPAAA